MRFSLSDGKIVIRFTLNFIIHQFLMLAFVSLPTVFYLTVFKGSTTAPAYTGIVAAISFFFYIVYCLFYGYYVAYPMANIILRVRQLAAGDYDLPKKQRFSNPANRLYREVYSNLNILANILQEEQQKRQDFEQQRQEWAAGVTHDLKTPLSYISGYADMLLSKEHQWTEAERNDFLQIIKDKSAYMEELIGDLGLVFRMDSESFMLPDKEKIELVEFIRRVAAETASMPDTKNDDFEIIEKQSSIYILGDKKLLHRAFTNLLVNAVVHNPAGTKITVKITVSPNLMITVSDNGKGLSKKELTHLFDRYYRGASTEEHEGSTGLGMAIVKQIITAHGGTITASSKPGNGTTFTVHLPSLPS
ncbi:Signal transduction histidine kinase [Lachnospiraceae bacterium NK3A20]|nr:Signal transduction histidine kinase [Lachnospiraceae bacterium NK3A20]